MIPVGVDGSTTSHGGIVNATQSTTSTSGKAWLLEGDGFLCPQCKIWSTLVRNNTSVSVAGRKAAIVGDKFTCGATLEKMQSSTWIGATASTLGNNVSAASHSSNFVSSDPNNEYGLKFQLIDENTTHPIPSFFYLIVTKDGQEFSGFTDDSGFTNIITTGNDSESIDLHLFDFSKPMDSW